MIDIGTGDGRFVYHSARRNPRRFYIGIDANARPLKKISEKIHRKPARGGAANVLFLQAAVEDLPEELTGVADEVHIHFPWGSLLRAVLAGDELVLRNLRRVCAEGAWLEVIVALEADRDETKVGSLGLPNISTEYLAGELVPRYRAMGFDIVEQRTLPASHWRDLRTTWAKRLQTNRARVLIYLVGRAI